MEKPESRNTSGKIKWQYIQHPETTTSGKDRVVEFIESTSRENFPTTIWRDSCARSWNFFTDQGLSSLELPLNDVGLYTLKNGMPLVGYKLEGTLSRPMQFIAKNIVSGLTGDTFQRMYLQQVITTFVGGYYTPTTGYTYKINNRKASGIQRSLSNLKYLDIEIEKLIIEANRFMYMYCRTEIN